MNNFSKIGFMLATLGSSIGLGHIWRFPYIAGTNGGGIFVLLYLFLALGLGIAILMCEMLIGNKGRANAFKSYENLAPPKAKAWRFAGLTLIGGPIILSFYAIVLGWVFVYLFTISFNLPTNIQDSQEIFTSLYANGFYQQSAGLLFVMFISAFIISKGIKKGIEMLNLILTPLLFIIFFILLLYAISMDSFFKALDFMLGFHWENASKALNFDTFINALGQVFFSLSIGVGIVVTYAASSNPTQNLFRSSLFIVLSGILIAIMAGLMLFTFVYEYGGSIDSGPSLIFINLPVMLSHLGILGNVICFLFLAAFSFAGITSTISLLEPCVAYICERYSFSRAKATWTLSFGITALGFILICSLCTPLSSVLKIGDKSLMDILEFLSANVIMTLGGLLVVIFVGWVVPKQNLISYTSHFFKASKLWEKFAKTLIIPLIPARFNTLREKIILLNYFDLWYVIIKYISPVVIIAILCAISIKFFIG